MAFLITGQRQDKMKKWAKIILIGAIAIAVAIVSFFLYTLATSVTSVTKYGTPHYRPKVE